VGGSRIIGENHQRRRRHLGGAASGGCRRVGVAALISIGGAASRHRWRSRHHKRGVSARSARAAAHRRLSSWRQRLGIVAQSWHALGVARRKCRSARARARRKLISGIAQRRQRGARGGGALARRNVSAASSLSHLGVAHRRRSSLGVMARRRRRRLGGAAAAARLIGGVIMARRRHKLGENDGGIGVAAWRARRK